MACLGIGEPDVPEREMSPPDPPRFVEPTRDEVASCIERCARDLVDASLAPYLGSAGECHRRVQLSLCQMELGDILAHGAGDETLVTINDDVVLDLQADIDNILTQTPHEDWPI